MCCCRFSGHDVCWQITSNYIRITKISYSTSANTLNYIHLSMEFTSPKKDLPQNGGCSTWADLRKWPSASNASTRRFHRSVGVVGHRTPRSDFGCWWRGQTDGIMMRSLMMRRNFRRMQNDTITLKYITIFFFVNIFLFFWWRCFILFF